MSEHRKVVVVGAGITGLATAYYLQKAMKEQGLPCKLKLLEASDRLGGKIKTTRKDGFIIERGPDSFLARKKPAIRLLQDFALQDKPITKSTALSYICIDDTLDTMRKGSFMVIPTNIQYSEVSPVL